MDHAGRSRPTDSPAILDALDVVVWQADARTTEFTFVSDGAAHLLGWTPEDANAGAGTFSTWLHPDDRETVLAAFLAGTAGDTIDLTHRLVARDGSVRRVHTVGRLLHDAEPRLAGVMVDVTAGHQGDESQLEAELRFRRVVERLPAIVYLEAADPNGDQPGSMLYVSPQVREILGFAPEEWINDPTAWVQHFHPDDRARVRQIYDAVSNGQGTFTAQYRMFTKEGTIRWFHDDALLIRDEQGTPMFWQGIMYDITDQRTSDALVRETEDRYRTLVEQLPAIVYSEDVTGDGLQVVYINSRVKELLGIEPEEWVADPSVWAASIHPDDAQMVDDVNRESERLSEPFSVEYRMIARDGRIVWFKDEARLVHHADGTPAYWQGVMIDITDRREAEAQVAEAEARYRALVEQMPSVTYVAGLGRGGGVLYISPQIGSMLGCPPQAWYTDSGLWNKLVHPEDADRGHPEPAVGEHNVR
ncbi:MAG: PAS domain-containing protein, partial [Myxococcota bacterium]